MALRNHTNSSTFVRIGMSFLIVAMLALRFLRPNSFLSEGAADAVKGLLMGIAIGCNGIAIRLMCRHGRAGQCG